MIKLRIEEILKEKEKTAYWLAKETGLHQSTIAKLRHNQSKALRLDVLEAVCEALGVEPGELIVRAKK